MAFKKNQVMNGAEKAPARSLFYAMGYTKEELERPLIAVVSAHSEIVPGHIHLDKITEAVKAGVRLAGGTPIMVPAFTGLGAPWWDPYARGALIGITRGVNKNHITRAALESMAYQTNDLVKAMEEDMGEMVQALRVDGGASINDFLLEFQAGILGKQVYRPRCIETTSLGAAYLAGLATGYWDSLDDIASNWEIDKIFEPNMALETRNSLVAGWHQAVKRTLSSDM